MKLKNIALSILGLGLILLVSNWVYGNVLTKKVDHYLKSNSKLYRQLPSFTYQGIRVHPLRGSVSLENVEVTQGCSFKAEEVHVYLNHKEARDIARNNNIEQLSYCKIVAENVRCEKDGYDLFVEKAEIKYDGWIDAKDIKKTQETNQDLKVKLTHLKGALDYFCGFENKINWDNKNDVVQSCVFSGSLLPIKNELQIDQFQLYSSLLNISAEATLVNKESFLRGLKLKSAQFDIQLQSQKYIQYGLENTTGVYAAQGVDQKMKGEILFDEQGDMINDSSAVNVDLSAKGLSIIFDEDTKRLYAGRLAFVGVSLEECTINDLVLQMELHQGKWYVDNSKLISPLLSADINGVIKYDFKKPGQSLIDSSNFVIHNIQPQVKGSIEGIERIFGLHIPRSGDSLVLQLKGSLKQPLVKGIHYN